MKFVCQKNIIGIRIFNFSISLVWGDIKNQPWWKVIYDTFKYSDGVVHRGLYFRKFAITSHTNLPRRNK